MKNALRATALSCAVLALGFSLSTSSVKAADNSDIVRTAQMRLASMGYYVGRYDGNMGPVTQTAIRDFQRTNGLTATGLLNPETYSLMQGRSTIAYQPVYRTTYSPVYSYAINGVGYYRTAYNDRILVTGLPIMWDDRWHYTHTQQIPSRYGKLDVSEDNRGSLRHYAVTLNGQPVLFANNQPQVLRVSNTYALNGEDAVIFTAYHGDGACAYKSYLLTVHNDGTFANPKEIGNCTGNFEAHVAENNSLMISFPSMNMASGWSTWDVWRYENDRLARI